MTTSEPMDLDSELVEKGDEAGSGEGGVEANVASNNPAMGPHQTSYTGTSPQSISVQQPGTGEQDMLGVIASREKQPFQKEAVANDEPMEGPVPIQEIRKLSPSRVASEEAIADEIVVASCHSALPKHNPTPSHTSGTAAHETVVAEAHGGTLAEGNPKASNQEYEVTTARFAPITPDPQSPREEMPIESTHDRPPAKAKLELNEDSETASEAPIASTRRNPKRSAAALVETQPVDDRVRENILDAALEPMTEAELEKWDGWIELESEPAFFNYILRELGAKDVQIQEVLCLDDDLIRQLPKPIHGLIFLFQYLSDDSDVDEESDAEETVDNACATVAMLNIVMNAPSIELGETLENFKESTKAMSSPLRGHALSTNKTIRKVHNSFTRRVDHFNADLWLSSKAEAANKKRTKRPQGRKSGKKSKKKSGESGYHFIAYVPVNGSVWELDGLKARPTKLEPVTSEDWALDALPKIWSRMEDDAGGFEFNLLAMCQSPLRDLCREIAAGARVLELIERRLDSLPGPSPTTTGAVAVPELPCPGKFPEYWVTSAMVSEAPIPPNTYHLLRLLGAIPSSTNEPSGPVSEGNGTTNEGVSIPRADFVSALREAGVLDPPAPSSSAGELFMTPEGIRLYLGALAKQVSAGQASAMARYDAEITSIGTDLERVEGRKKDYTPAIHAWVKILAEKGVLEQLVG
ncbi:uncharacterized protein DNG_04028 [Cephalotrichum gorgonifer]|uniref:Ubiquitin carboxyl-terminal hydrolase n=1 Tax=Cephalotrichum gorgonifer TaxID=2041049 RepID=A0AAE8MVA7_9PEZI|nr:uncharacterized protein DNG_04028 [Cephalotrichum gorgonifer]